MASQKCAFGKRVARQFEYKGNRLPDEMSEFSGTVRALGEGLLGGDHTSHAHTHTNSHTVVLDIMICTLFWRIDM